VTEAPSAMPTLAEEHRRLVVLAAAALALTAGVVVTELHARSLTAQRDRSAPALRAAASAVGAELALHAGSRWLRHPTRSEPWAYGHDGPGVFDPDPAGAFASPPRATLVRGSVSTHASLRRRP
jgi:hypothetical protein